ncbi:hypothetical protein [Allostreptomyces psammosilenae]|uniref:Secreted protein n=1 Tax=Allostreptomyces psammosilenae TaxID=1892865 RepID=A0A852ZYV3_9ACTN|nr:hypothetical protein [Allostreptomyces psammosilenae]NYI03462.1 hypothetical protein [Allostreptomyces psammosilenae]
MPTRLRALMVTTVAAAGIALAGAAPTAAAAPADPHTGAARVQASQTLRAMDYWQFHSHHATLDACVAVGEQYLWPNHPGGSDDYECLANNGGWDLYLIFAT